MLAVAGFVWVETDLAAFALFGGALALLGGVTAVFVDVRTSRRQDIKPSPSREVWWIAPGLTLLAVTALAMSSPNGLSLRFRWDDEGRLSRLLPTAVQVTRTAPDQCTSGQDLAAVPVFGGLSSVCTQSGPHSYTAFHANDHYQVGGYAYLYAPGMTLSTTQATIGGEDCVLHLDGPWWELGPGGGGIGCPGGFDYVPGP